MTASHLAPVHKHRLGLWTCRLSSGLIPRVQGLALGSSAHPVVFVPAAEAISMDGGPVSLAVSVMAPV